MTAKQSAYWRPRTPTFLTATLAMTLLLQACEGVGIVTSDDPFEKLSQSEYLRVESGRLMQSRRVLAQAIEIFERNGDKNGLARAYRQYGLLAREGGANADPIVFRDPHAPLHPSTEELDLSDGYLKRAAALAGDTKQLNLTANINYILGNNQIYRGTPKTACSYFDLALKDFRKAKIEEPDVQVYLLPGTTSPIESVEQAQEKAGCSQAP